MDHRADEERASPENESPAPSPAKPPPEPPRKRRRWGRILLLSLFPALFLTGTAGAFWTGYRLYDQPFVWYNSNRIAAVADRAARGTGTRDTPAPVVVVLGGAALRNATLDEDGMAKLAARQGVERLQFLRIVHPNAEFADFEPMLGAVLKLKPELVLLDLDLLFAERPSLAGLRHYGTVLTGMALDGKPYLPDQIALQYDKPCRALNAAGTTREELDHRVEEVREAVALRPESPAFERVRRFADQARAGGTRVALLHLRRPASFEERLYGPGNSYLPDALARLSERPGLPLWHFPETVQKSGHYCRNGTLGPEGRKAYSAWLAAGIAQVLSQPRVEEAALQ
ncbi:hypothetical protein [Azospirillum sp. sgz302134]